MAARIPKRFCCTISRVSRCSCASWRKREGGEQGRGRRDGQGVLGRRWARRSGSPHGESGAAARISLTDRRAASQVVISTFSRGTKGAQMDWGVITSTTTLALYMPGPDYAEVAHRLREGGLPDDLPCVIVSNATGAEQQIRWTSIARLAHEERLPAPALMIVGRVASQKIQEISKAFWRDELSEQHTRRPAVS